MKGNIIIITGSVIVAGLFWFTVTMSNVYQQVFVIPLVCEELPANHALKTPLPQTIRVTLKGTGWQLLLLKLSKSLRYEIPENLIRNERYFSTNKYLSEALKLSGDVQPIEAFPETLLIAYDTFASKRVPISVEYSLECTEGYGQVEPALLSPDTVLISGAESILKSITSWKTKPAVFKNISSDISTQIELSDSLANIIRFNLKTARLVIPVQQLADVEFRSIPLVLTGVPESKQVLLSSSAVDIVVRGGIRKMSSLTAENFSAMIDYNSLINDTSNVTVPQIKLPEGTILLKTNPESVRFTIRQ